MYKRDAVSSTPTSGGANAPVGAPPSYESLTQLPSVASAGSVASVASVASARLTAPPLILGTCQLECSAARDRQMKEMCDWLEAVGDPYTLHDAFGAYLPISDLEVTLYTTLMSGLCDALCRQFPIGPRKHFGGMIRKVYAKVERERDPTVQVPEFLRLLAEIPEITVYKLYIALGDGVNIGAAGTIHRLCYAYCKPFAV